MCVYAFLGLEEPNPQISVACVVLPLPLREPYFQICKVATLNVGNLSI